METKPWEREWDERTRRAVWNALRAHAAHYFTPQEEDQDTCLVCGANFRDTFQHITHAERRPLSFGDRCNLTKDALAKARGEV